MNNINMNEVFQRLVAIAGSENGGARGDTVLSCDMLHQEALYTVQAGLAGLLADVANACGPIATQRLEREFPRVFETR